MPNVYSKPKQKNNSYPIRGNVFVLIQNLSAIKIAENNKRSKNFKMLYYSKRNFGTIPKGAKVSIPLMYSTVKWEDYVNGETNFLYFNKGKVGDTDMPPYVTLINEVMHICVFYHGAYYMVECGGIPLETHQGFLKSWPEKKARWALDRREDDPDAGCYRRYIQSLSSSTHKEEEDDLGLNAPDTIELSSDYIDDIDWVEGSDGSCGSCGSCAWKLLKFPASQGRRVSKDLNKKSN